MADKWVVQYTVEYDSPDKIEAHVTAIAGMEGLTLTNVSAAFDKKFVVP